MADVQLVKIENDLLTEDASQNPAIVYLASLPSAASRRPLKAALNTVAEMLGYSKQLGISNGRRADNITYQFVEWRAIRFQHLNAIRAKLLETYKPATANKMLSALRGVLKMAYLLDQIPESEYRKFEQVENVRNETEPAGRYIEHSEIDALIDVCKADKSPHGLRDLAVLGLLYNCGLRRSELAALNIEDVNISSGAVVVTSGKGRKARTVYAANGALEALRIWLKVRRIENGPLFIRIRSGEQLTEERFTDQAVYEILKERSKQAGIKTLSPHDWRRTFITDLLDGGVDISTTQKMAGHSDPGTTVRYDRRGEDAKKKAAQVIKFS